MTTVYLFTNHQFLICLPTVYPYKNTKRNKQLTNKHLPPNPKKIPVLKVLGLNPNGITAEKEVNRLIYLLFLYSFLKIRHSGIRFPNPRYLIYRFFIKSLTQFCMLSRFSPFNNLPSCHFNSGYVFLNSFTLPVIPLPPDVANGTSILPFRS